MNKEEQIKAGLTGIRDTLQGLVNQKSFDNQEMNNTVKNGVIPADTILTDSKVKIPEAVQKTNSNIGDTISPMVEQQVKSQTDLQKLTEQRIADQQKLNAEQNTFIGALGTGGADIQAEYDKQQDLIKPIEKDIVDLTARINQANASLKQGLINEEGRTIPMKYLTGRQYILQQQGNAKITELSALLDAKNGQLKNAQDKLDTTLNLKKEIRQADIDERQAKVNLYKEITGQSLKNEENEIARLKAQQDIFEKRYESIRDVVFENIASVPSDIVEQVLSSNSLEELNSALTSATPYLGEADRVKMELDKMDLNAKISEQNALASGVLTGEKLKLATELRKELNANTLYKSGVDFQRQGSNVLGLLSNADVSGIDGITIINAFQKLVDEGVAVREGDVALIQSASSATERANLYLKQLNKSGGKILTDAQIEDMLSTTKQLLDGASVGIKTAIAPIKTTSEENGIDFEKYISSFDVLNSKDIERIADGIVSSGGTININKLSTEQEQRLATASAKLGVPFSEIISDKEMIDFVLDGDNTPLIEDVNDRKLSSLSREFESGGNIGAIGYDSTGGYSYGSYQLTQANAPKFLQTSMFGEEFNGLKPGTKEFDNKWKEMSKKYPGQFEVEQRNYIKNTHYIPQVQKLASTFGISELDMSPTLRKVIWSTAVQHGGATDVIAKVINKFGFDNEAKLISAIYDERKKRFPSSTPKVRESVINRLEKEKKVALSEIYTA